MEYTERLKKWLSNELGDLIKDVLEVERSTMPTFNKGVEIKNAHDVKVERILNKIAVPDLYEALKAIMSERYDDWSPAYKQAKKALAKARL